MTKTEKQFLRGGDWDCVIFAPIWIVLFNKRGYQTPNNPGEIIPPYLDAIIYGKEDLVGGDPSVYERIMSYNLLGGNQYPEEAQAEADKEVERLVN